MKIDLNDRDRKIIVLRWLKQGYIETTDFKEMVQEIKIQICESKKDVENIDNPDYWEEERKGVYKHTTPHPLE